MKIIDSFSNKINFIDKNDVFVGYDLSQNCCEDAGWYITDKIIPYTYTNSDIEYHIPDISNYIFDAEFFREIESIDLDSGNMVVFKLISFMKPDLYLHLYNSHNGYYGHGFEVKHSGIIIKDDML